MSQYVFRVCEDEGIAYTEEELDGLLPVMQEVNNNTGMLCNCGYTPAERSPREKDNRNRSTTAPLPNHRKT